MLPKQVSKTQMVTVKSITLLMQMVTVLMTRLQPSALMVVLTPIVMAHLIISISMQMAIRYQTR